MRYTHAVAVLFAVLLVVPTGASADVVGEPDLSATVAENRVVPGEETTLEVTLMNEGNLVSGSFRNPELEDRVTTARGVRVSLDAEDAPLDVKTGERAVGNVPVGVSSPVPFRVVVDEDAEPGRYAMEVTVLYTYTRFIEELEENEPRTDEVAARFEEGTSRRFTVYVEVEEHARFEVESVEGDVAVGGSGSVAVAVRNVGSETARDARLSVASENPEFTLGDGANSASTYAGAWEPGENRTFRFRAAVAPDAERRSYALDAVVEFEDADGQRRESDPLVLGVTPLSEATFGVEAVRSSLRVGDEGSIRGTVVNAGETTARNAVVVFETDRSTVEPLETQVSVGDLEPGEGVPFEFGVDVSDAAEAGPRQFSLAVQYRDADGDVLRSDPLDVRVEVGGRQKEFAVEPVRATVRAGGSDRLELRVTNAGDETLTDVSAKLFADAPVSASDDEVFVAELAPGENATVVFGVAVESGAIAKTYPVTLDFQYEDEDGDVRISDAYRVPLAVEESGQGDGGLPVVVTVVGVALLVAIAGYVGFRYRR